MNRRPLQVFALLAGLGITVALSGPAGQAQTPPPIILRNDPVSFRDVVKGVLPAVVSVESRATVSRNGAIRGPRNDDGQIPEDFRKFFEERERKYNAGPSVEQTVGFGSGFIVDAKGIILTNNHVVENAEVVEITLMDGRKFKSTEVKNDPRTDLAIVRFDPKGAKLPALEMGDSNQMEIGDRVLAIGAPFGLSGSVTHGIISAKSRDLNLNRYDDFIQTDAAINPGNSGGPLINLEGKVVGINSAIQTTSRNPGFQGVSMAISSNMAKTVLDALVRDGVVKRPYIGIEAASATPDVLAQYGLQNGGVLIGNVGSKGPAAKGGLKADDAILTVNGKVIKDIRELQRTIAGQTVGSTIDIQVLREGKPMTLKVKLEEEPENYGKSRTRNPRLTLENEGITVEYAGMELVNLNATQAEQRGLNQKGAAIIKSVEQGGVAHSAGLAPGIVIVKVNKKTVTSAGEAKDAIEETINGDGALLHLMVGDSTAIRMLKAK